jgi:hypothetical protein
MIVINGSIGNWFAPGISWVAVIHRAEPSVVVSHIRPILNERHLHRDLRVRMAAFFDPRRRLFTEKRKEGYRSALQVEALTLEN